MSARAQPVVIVREPEVPLPSKFKGSKTCSTKNFKNTMETIFVLQPGSFASDANRIIYIAAFFEGSALSWYLRLVDDGHPSLQSLPEFWEHFLARFKSNVTETDAEVNLLRIRQRYGERIADFNSRFMDLASKVPYEERSLQGIYLHALSRAILVEFDRILSPPTTLDEVMQLCELLESRQRRLEYLFPSSSPQSRFGTPGPVPNHRPRPSHISSDAVTRPPLAGARTSFKRQDSETSANFPARRSQLSDEERQRRVSMNLCLYCGDSGHKIGNCPKSRFYDPKN